MLLLRLNSESACHNADAAHRGLTNAGGELLLQLQGPCDKALRCQSASKVKRRCKGESLTGWYRPKLLLAARRLPAVGRTGCSRCLLTTVLTLGSHRKARHFLGSFSTQQQQHLMGWSGEVHDSRVTTAFLAAKREARLKRAHKLPEAQGNSGGWPLAAVAGLLLSAAALQQDGNWRRATSKLQHFWRQLPLLGSQQVWQVYEAQLTYV